LRKLLRSRHAISPVISNIILIAAVVSVGFAVLAWAYSSSNSYARQYGGSVLSNVNQLKERLAFEYVFYSSTTKSLSVYIMNYGNVGTVTLATLKVSNSSWTISSTTTITLYLLNSTSTAALGVGQEGNFTLSPFPSSSTTLQSGSYTISLVTGRGSSFASTFAM
jgi:hypothetical protein